MKTCLIGQKLNYSFSSKIHSMLGDSEYSLLEINEEDLKYFIFKKKYIGFNVTNPYKEKIIKYLDCVDEEAKLVGAVNTVVLKDNRYFGFNTDIYGLQKTIENNDIEIGNNTVLILGSGGASKACKYIVNKLNGKPIIVSRSGEINYSNIYELNPSVIINATPVGNINDFGRIIELNRFKDVKAVIDLTYNPINTKLLQDAKALNIKSINGLEMLTYQAIKAHELFFDTKVNNDAKYIINLLLKEQRNIVLEGMSGAGKTVIGEALSKEIGYKFIDIDEEIEKKYGNIKDIFENLGEAKFREYESEIIKEYSFKNNYVISLGGGAILNKENVELLKSNGLFILVDRDLNKLDRTNRPLVKDVEDVKKLYEQRKDTYLKNADIIIKNDSDIKTIIKRILELI